MYKLIQLHKEVFILNMGFECLKKKHCSFNLKCK